MKVIFFSFFSGTIGLSIYLYMAGSNISYLDLDSPSSEEVICLTRWPLLAPRSPWSLLLDLLFHRGDGFSGHDSIDHLRCEVPDLSHAKCRSVNVPVHDMKRPLALAIDAPTGRYDVLGALALLFLAITFCIWTGMTTHDLALIGRSQRDFVLDVPGVNQHFPMIRKIWRCLAGYRSLTRLMAHEKPGPRVVGAVVAVALAPVLLVWNIVVFNFIIVPLLLLAFAWHPVRMSRAWVFIVSIACTIYGFALAFLQIGFMVSPSVRPMYAVTWQPELSTTNVTTTDGSCTCGCDYPVSESVTMNLVMIGLGTALKSLFLALRCLKGLRRSQWANLLSVVFPVPVTLYSVDWRLPDGQPIKFRTEGVAVQEEIAFDPFAMMDEQLESAYTTVHLRPEPVHKFRRDASGEVRVMKPHRIMATPSIPSPSQVQVRDSEYIGCCGFPWPTGGRQCVYEAEFLAQLGDDDLEGHGSAEASTAGDGEPPRSIERSTSDVSSSGAGRLPESHTPRAAPPQ